MEKKTRKHRIRWIRLILVIAIHAGVGFIPLQFINVRANRAKAELARDLQDKYLFGTPSLQAIQILGKAAKDPEYAGKQIHVWSDHNQPYKTFVGGGAEWKTKCVLIYSNEGGEIADIIIADQRLAFLLWAISITWWVFPYACLLRDYLEKNNF